MGRVALESSRGGSGVFPGLKMSLFIMCDCSDVLYLCKDGLWCMCNVITGVE